MIIKFRDHAANERTYLAWVRTAIGVMGFGFVIERFSLFIERFEALYRTPPAAGYTVGWHAGSMTGLILIVMGLGVIAVATVRFIRISRQIETEQAESIGIRADILLSGLLALVGLGVLVYAAHLVL